MSKPNPHRRRVFRDINRGHEYVVQGDREPKAHEIVVGDAPDVDAHDEWRIPAKRCAVHGIETPASITRQPVHLRKTLAAKGWELIETPPSHHLMELDGRLVPSVEVCEVPGYDDPPDVELEATTLGPLVDEVE